MRVVPLVVACAVAAKKLKRPVRCMYNRKTDMITTGGRHPFYAKWKVGVKEDGKILALDVQVAYPLSLLYLASTPPHHP